MHAVDRLARGHELVQGLQHEPVAAECDDDVGVGRRAFAIASNQRGACFLGLGRLTCHKRDALKTIGHRHATRRNRATRQMDRTGMERIVFVYTTYPSIVEAEAAGRALVERELAACVNILPGMVSIYRWQGAIERGEEVVMIIKTRAALAEAVGAAVKDMHSYATPAILVIPVESVDKDYLSWLTAGTEQGAK
jgi:periplasmic divalent cation tolerance protein